MDDGDLGDGRVSMEKSTEQIVIHHSSLSSSLPTAFNKWIKGTNRSRWTPSRYRSSGSLLEVEITVTLLENKFENSRCIIIASATSVTWNSSKKRTLLRLAILRAISGSGSLRAPIYEIPKIDMIFAYHIFDAADAISC